MVAWFKLHGEVFCSMVVYWWFGAGCMVVRWYGGKVVWWYGGPPLVVWCMVCGK